MLVTIYMTVITTEAGILTYIWVGDGVLSTLGTILGIIVVGMDGILLGITQDGTPRGITEDGMDGIDLGTMVADGMTLGIMEEVVMAVVITTDSMMDITVAWEEPVQEEVLVLIGPVPLIGHHHITEDYIRTEGHLMKMLVVQQSLVARQVQEQE